jgi:bifunctional DNase/RNase
MSDEVNTSEGLEEAPSAAERMADFAIMMVGGVFVDLPETFATVTFQEHEPPFRAFQLPVGLADGAAIAAMTEDRPSPRPSTQDLFATALKRTGV